MKALPAYLFCQSKGYKCYWESSWGREGLFASDATAVRQDSISPDGAGVLFEPAEASCRIAAHGDVRPPMP